MIASAYDVPDGMQHYMSPYICNSQLYVLPNPHFAIVSLFCVVSLDRYNTEIQLFLTLLK